jgi:hypothetical protein
MIFTVDRHIGTAALYDLVHSHLPSSLRNEMLDEEMDEEDNNFVGELSKPE